MNKPGTRFIHCLHLDGRGGCREAESDDLSAESVHEGALWVHFDYSEQAAIQWLQDESGVDPLIIDALTAAETRPRSFITEQGLFLILRGVNTNPDEDTEDMVSVRLWIEKRRIITSRRRRIMSVQDIRTSLDKGQGPSSAGTFLTTLIELMADRIGVFVDEIEGRLVEAEDALVTLETKGVRQGLGKLRRQIASVRRFLAPQRDALDRLCRQPIEFLSTIDVLTLREEADRLARHLEDLDLARERSVVLQEELLSQLAQEQNTRMYVLSVVAAIFLPLTFITGLLGMNVGGLPGVESAFGFTAAMVTMVAATIFIIVLFKLKKWI